jgi:class 3 adenylate cyclase
MDTQSLQRRLGSRAPMSTADLFALWEAHDEAAWKKSPALYEQLGQRVLKAGEPLVAHDILQEGLNHAPGAVRLRQRMALALARGGGAARAQTLLLRLRQEGHHDEETLGLLGRTYKDLAARASSAAEGRRLLKKAYASYADAFRRHRGFYSGINAASTALFLGAASAARSLADTVYRICRRRLRRAGSAGPGDYWLLATLGEAALIRGRREEAEDWYRRAAAAGADNFPDQSSTRRQARRVARALDARGDVAARIDACFHIPSVVAYTGHMIDRPGRAFPRFPAGLAGRVRGLIDERLRELDAHFGYGSAACGADILFAEALLARGGELHLVLPVPRDEMRRGSVEIVPGDWGARFDAVLARAARVYVASDRGGSGEDVVYDYANSIIHGIARLRAQALDTRLEAIAVWDRRSANLPGSTAAFIRDWETRERPVRVVDLDALLREEGLRRGEARIPGDAGPAVAPRAEFGQQVMAILFADAVGYSRLAERQIPRFATQFLGEVSATLMRGRGAPRAKNTWGDAIYFVFDDLEKAGIFALELSERVARIDWTRRGLPERLTFRIALHAGPIYAFTNPITGQSDFTGSHVSRAARIEPVTPPGQVYASQGFAALAAAGGARGFDCEYVGQISLAKNYGAFPIYHIRRR